MEESPTTEKSIYDNSLEEYKRKAIDLLLKNNVLLKSEYQKKFDELNSKEEILAYANTLLEENNANSESNIDKNSKSGKIRIVNSYAEHMKKREINDFVEHYNHRFRTLSKILREREIDDLTSIGLIKMLKDREQISTIGMVYDKTETKNGHIAIHLEDRTGVVKAIVTKNNERMHKVATDLVLDEVVAVSGTAGNDVMFVSNIMHPDIIEDIKPKKSQEEEYAVFIGDAHIGSKLFYKNSFNDFLDWVSGAKISSASESAVKSQAIVDKIKYVIIPGDLIEGVGIFPY